MRGIIFTHPYGGLNEFDWQGIFFDDFTNWLDFKIGLANFL